MKKYLYYRRGYLLLWLITCGIILGVQALYGIAAESILYGIGLSGFALLLFGIGDFLRFREKEEKRKDLTRTMGTREFVPYVSRDPLEQEYLAMLKELSDRCCQQNDGLQTQARERQEYYTTWVHQIKTPIAAMNMLLQDQDSDLARNLRIQVFRVEEYVEMILHYARLEESGSDFVFAVYDLDEMVRKTIRKYAPIFIQKKLTLHYEPVEAKLLTDEKWFCFVLEQILSNALKYTNQGSITIALSQPDVLTISDTGLGIAAEDVPRVFEKGYTGYNGRADHKSTGLGLYLCKKTMDRLRHRISLTSVVGQGTSVSIDFGRENRTIE